MNILDQIVAAKQNEVVLRKASKSLKQLEAMPFFEQNTLSLKQFLTDPLKTGIIAEFKRKSPSKGIINAAATVEQVTAAYSAHGAAGISVLTDEHFFGGTLKDLQAATINDIPLLRKDFMIDAYQLYEAKAYGADVILLIASCLTKKEVKDLSAIAKSLQMEVLLELHDETELDHISEHTEIIGINNRNLKNFEVDIENSIRLADKIGTSKIKVAESGISSVDDIHLFRRNGFQGFLMGEAFMKHADPAIAFASFVQQLNS